MNSTLEEVRVLFSTSHPFTLDSCHPGISDSEYLFRRHFFHSLCRAHRIADAEPPHIHYIPEEEALWTHILSKLDVLHLQCACAEYLEGKKILGLSAKEIPQAHTLSGIIRGKTGFGLAPAEGLLDFPEFFRLISNGKLPCTQFLRHGSSPEFTPEPDMVHDLIGHVPLLVDDAITDTMRAIGNAARFATADELIMLNRLYWFGIEFGLVREHDRIKIFGAGILSSPGEIHHALSSNVTKIEFSLERVGSTNYDPTRFQDTLFVVSSLNQLKEETLTAISRFKHFGRERK